MHVFHHSKHYSYILHSFGQVKKRQSFWKALPLDIIVMLERIILIVEGRPSQVYSTTGVRNAPSIYLANRK